MRRSKTRCSTRLIAVISAMVLFLSMSGIGWAQSESGKSQTRDGLHFNVPDDWPIEKRNGILAPIPVEEYLSIKFDKLDERLRKIEREYSGFDIRLRVLEEAAKDKETQGLRSTGGL